MDASFAIVRSCQLAFTSEDVLKPRNVQSKKTCPQTFDRCQFLPRSRDEANEKQPLCFGDGYLFAMTRKPTQPWGSVQWEMGQFKGEVDSDFHTRESPSAFLVRLNRNCAESDGLH